MNPIIYQPNCEECYWASQCGKNTEAALNGANDGTCEEFTPLDNRLEEQAYRCDLDMRQTIYREFADTYTDSPTLI